MISKLKNYQRGLIAAFGIVWLSAGCATTRYKGEMIPEQEASMPPERKAQILEATNWVKPADADQIPVFKVTNGDKGADGKMQVSVAQIAGSPVKITKFDNSINWGAYVTADESFLDGLGWRFYPYREDESWRKGYCYWQVPLNWVTIFVWAQLPLYWTCKPSAPSDQGLREKLIAQQAQKIAVTTGSEAVIVFFKDTSVTTIQNGVPTSTQIAKSTSAQIHPISLKGASKAAETAAPNERKKLCRGLKRGSNRQGALDTLGTPGSIAVVQGKDVNINSFADGDAAPQLTDPAAEQETWIYFEPNSATEKTCTVQFKKGKLVKAQ